MREALWFSGGKDSMACLYLLRERLAEIHVVFVNAGKCYPEALEVIDRARALCPNWVEVRSDRDAQWAANGLPTSLVPVDSTALGRRLTGKQGPVMVQSYLQCCHDNLWRPMWEKTVSLGVDTVYTGSRDDDTRRAPMRHGERRNGVMFLHPVRDWTREQVLEYLKAQMGGLPEHYALAHSSMDCYDCTAYMGETLDRINYTAARHPDLYADWRGKFAALHGAIAQGAAELAAAGEAFGIHG